MELSELNSVTHGCIFHTFVESAKVLNWSFFHVSNFCMKLVVIKVDVSILK